MIFGRTQGEHDKALNDTLKALTANGLKLNQSKCEFNRDHITFFGLVFKKSGISPDPAKVSAIRESNSPANAGELRSFLGMTSYFPRFIPNYSTVSEPLRRLTRSDTDWKWTSEQEHAFKSLTNLMSSDVVMGYSNYNKEIKRVVDASPVGLDAILTLEEKVEAYASRSLSESESRYSQTERKIVWACEHFDI